MQTRDINYYIRALTCILIRARSGDYPHGTRARSRRGCPAVSGRERETQTQWPSQRTKVASQVDSARIDPVESSHCCMVTNAHHAANWHAAAGVASPLNGNILIRTDLQSPHFVLFNPLFKCFFFIQTSFFDHLMTIKK